MGRFRGRKLCIILISMILGSSVAAVSAVDYFNSISKASSSEVSRYMMKNESGISLKLPIDKKNPISIVINNLPEKDKQKVKEAVNRLDSISTNLNYTILDNDNVKIKNKIYINDGDMAGDVFGLTSFSYNSGEAKINYPIYITIDLDKCHEVFSTETGDNAVTAVAKHELTHTLGFADLYAEEHKNESIMWHELNLEDWTPSDEERIRKVYGGEKEIIKSSETSTTLNDIDYVLKSSDMLTMTHSDVFGSVYEPNKILFKANRKEDLFLDNSNQREY